MRPLLPIVVALTLAAGASAEAAADRVTVRTSLGPITAEDTRQLRARGTAPRGSTLVVRFYRGNKRIGTRRPELEGRRYSAAKVIDRTAEYRVRVTATTPEGKRIEVRARLTYGPTAEAPSAPD